MGIRIYHNLAALGADRFLEINRAAVEKSIEKLSSGLRINRASDDAAGLTISEKLRAQVGGLNRASMNAQDGISMMNTAEGALSEVHSILQRVRELAVQAANDTLTQSDRGEIQKEIDQLKGEINRIADTTEFNTKKLLNGSATALVSTDSPGKLDVIVRDVVREGNYRIEKQHVPSNAHVLKSDIFNLEANTKNPDGLRGLASGFDSLEPIFGGVGEEFRSDDFTDFQNMDWSKDVGGAGNERQDFRVTLAKVDDVTADQFYVVDHNFATDGGKTGFAVSITGIGPNQHPVAGDSGYYELEVTAVLDNGGTLLTAGGTTDALELTVRKLNAAGDIVDSATFNVSHSAAIDGADLLGSDGAQFVTTGATSITLGDAGTDYNVGDKMVFAINAAEDLPDVASGVYVQQLIQDTGDNGFQLDGTGASVANDTVSDRVGLWSVVGTSLDAVDGKTVAANIMYYDNEDNRQLGSGTVRYGEPGWTVVGEGYTEFNMVSTTLAERTTQIQNIDKFQGIFDLGAQSVTVYTANGNKANVVLNGTDTLENVATKFRTAMLKSVESGGLGLSVDGNLDRATGVDANTAVYVSSGVENSDEAVAGTLVFRSTLPGLDGRLAFAADQSLLDALSLATIQEPNDPMTLRITDAHTGELIGTAVTDDGVIRNVIQGVDLVQDARSDLSVRFASADARMEAGDIIEGAAAGVLSSQSTDIIAGPDSFSRAAFINFQGLEPDAAAAGSTDNVVQDYELSVQAASDQFSVADFNFVTGAAKGTFSLATTLGAGNFDDGGANASVIGSVFGGTVEAGLFSTPKNLDSADQYQLVTVDNVNGNAIGDQFAVADFSITNATSDFTGLAWTSGVTSTGLLTEGGYYEMEWSTTAVLANMVDNGAEVSTATIRAYDRNGNIVSTGSVKVGDTTLGAQFEATDAIQFFSNSVSGLSADYDVEGTYAITLGNNAAANITAGDRILFAVRDTSAAAALTQLQVDVMGATGFNTANTTLAANDATDFLTWDAGLIVAGGNTSTALARYGLMDTIGTLGAGGSAQGDVTNLQLATLAAMAGSALSIGELDVLLGDHGTVPQADGALIFDLGVATGAATSAAIGSTTRAGYFVVEVTGIDVDAAGAGGIVRTAGSAATLTNADLGAGVEFLISRYSGTGDLLEERTVILGAAATSSIAVDNTALNLFGTMITDGTDEITGFLSENAVRGNAAVILGMGATYAVGDKLAFAVADGGDTGTYVANLNNDATQDDGFLEITGEGGTFLHNSNINAGTETQAVTRVGLIDNVGTLASAAGSRTAVSLGYFDTNGQFNVGGGQVNLAQSGATIQAGTALFSLSEITPDGPGFVFESAPGAAVEYVHIVDNRTVLHIGANKDQTLATSIGAMDTRALGIDDILVVSQQLAEEAIQKADDAIGTVSSERAKLGAYVNRLEHTINVLDIQSENLLAAESRIRDLDMAKSTIDFTRNQILMNAGVALLAQANSMPQAVLQLLR